MKNVFILSMLTIASLIVSTLTEIGYIALIPVIIILFLFTKSCIKGISNFLKRTSVIKIKKGRHRAEWKLIPFISFGEKDLSYIYNFKKNCIYNFTGSNKKDNGDVNKLYGVVRFLNIHKDSARFGWNISKDLKRIRIYAYYYIEGIRYSDFLTEININENTRFDIQLRDGKAYYYVNDNYCFRHNFHKFIFGFQTYVWFGGNMTAPHDMEILKRRV